MGVGQRQYMNLDEENNKENGAWIKILHWNKDTHKDLNRQSNQEWILNRMQQPWHTQKLNQWQNKGGDKS